MNGGTWNAMGIQWSSQRIMAQCAHGDDFYPLNRPRSGA
jgi:hypothetical protein